MLSAGEKAPQFTLNDTDGNTVKLSDFKGKKVVLYFYPKDLTPGCTVEACAFRDDIGAFKKLGAVVLGVSADSEKTHQKFTAKHDLNFPAGVRLRTVRPTTEPRSSSPAHHSLMT